MATHMDGLSWGEGLAGALLLPALAPITGLGAISGDVVRVEGAVLITVEPFIEIAVNGLRSISSLPSELTVFERAPEVAGRWCRAVAVAGLSRVVSTLSRLAGELPP